MVVDVMVARTGIRLLNTNRRTRDQPKPYSLPNTYLVLLTTIAIKYCCVIAPPHCVVYVMTVSI